MSYACFYVTKYVCQENTAHKKQRGLSHVYI